METTSAPKFDIAGFIAWIEKRGGFSAAEKEQLSKLAEKLQKGEEDMASGKDARPAKALARRPF